MQLPGFLKGGIPEPNTLNPTRYIDLDIFHPISLGDTES